MNNRPIRVLHTICGLSGGGLERWLVDIVRLSDPSKVEHRVFVLYPDLGGSPVYREALESLGVLNSSPPGLRTRLLSALARRGRAHKTASLHNRLSLFSRGLASLLALPRAVRLFNQFKPDVIHAHSGADLLLALLLQARFKRPLVHTVPCLFSQMRAEGLSWLPGVYRRAHRRIDVFSTGEAKTELLAIGIPQEKILYDLGGVDLALSGDQPCDWRREKILERLHLPANTLLALSAGRLHPTKGHDHAIDVVASAASQIPNLHLLIIGDGPERDALADRALKAGVADRVHLFGFVRNPRPIFEAADIYFRTTTLEPENLAFYEAMATGLPTVGFKTAWRDLIVEVGHGQVVPMGDVPAFASAVIDILSSPDRGSALGQRARDYAAEHLSVQTSVETLGATYSRLAEDKKQGPGG